MITEVLNGTGHHGFPERRAAPSQATLSPVTDLVLLQVDTLE